MLGESVRDARVCDLYAGGGALGLEALSRGAREAVFVEQRGAVLRFLRENVREVAGARVVPGDVLRVIRRLETGFDLVLCDPPYDRGLVQATLREIARQGLVRAEGLVVMEHSRKEQPDPAGEWIVEKQAHYGESWVTVLRRKA